MNKPSDAAVRAAEKIKEQLRYHGPTSVDKIANIIDAEFEAERKALIAVARAAVEVEKLDRKCGAYGSAEILHKALSSLPKGIL